MATKKKPTLLKINVERLVQEFSTDDFPTETLAKVIHRGVMDNGINYEIHVVITTDEDEFIDD